MTIYVRYEDSGGVELDKENSWPSFTVSSVSNITLDWVQILFFLLTYFSGFLLSLFPF